MTIAIFTNQIKKISTFIYILLLLFILLLVFKLHYSWDGIRIIVKFYIYVFSFYIIFNFSTLDTQLLKADFNKNYGITGEIRLFIVSRLLPLLFIYLISVIFTFIIYLDKDSWPWKPALELMNGRFTHTFVYSLILLVILKLRKEPRIAIPLFLILSVIYFFLYKLVYIFSPSGIAVSGLKIFQIILIQLFLFHEFFHDRLKVYISFLFACVIGLFIYGSIVGMFFVVNSYSSPLSYSREKSSLVLLDMGYSSSIKSLENIINKNLRHDLLHEFFFYSNQYNYSITITPVKWEQLLLVSNMKTMEKIFDYLYRKKIIISEEALVSIARTKSQTEKNALINSIKFIKYTAKYIPQSFKDMNKVIYKSNKYFKIWCIRVIAEARYIDSIPYLVNILTDIDNVLSTEAYRALVTITGLDPVKSFNIQINNPVTLVKFIDYYKKERK